MSSVQVIQRHAFERTQRVGLSLARAAAPDSPVHAVNEGGFPSTFRAALELASASDADWTVMVDGDVLLLPDAIGRGLDLATRYPRDHFVVSGCVHDRLLGTVRHGGVRFYRTRLIPCALELEGWEGQIRPESTLIRLMGERGTPSATTALLAGMHDFEQYYRDLFRTAVVHAAKFSKRLDLNLARWARLAVDDPDFAVILEGALHGRRTGEASLDRSDHLTAAAEALERLGLTEKAELPADAPLDPLGMAERGVVRLRAATPLRRLLPELTLRLAPAPGQPRRLRRLRMLIRHRRRLRDRSAIPLRRVL